MKVAKGVRRPRQGATMLAFASLIALGACANTTTAASDPSPASTKVAGATDNSTSVGKVSDALGQRLDGMLNQGAHHP